jgi:hypothetical protein
MVYVMQRHRFSARYELLITVDTNFGLQRTNIESTRPCFIQLVLTGKTVLVGKKEWKEDEGRGYIEINNERTR